MGEIESEAISENAPEKVSEFVGFKIFIARIFSTETFESLVQHTTFSPPIFKIPNAKDPIFHIGVTLEKLGCQTILIERDYTDRDYVSEFSTFYAKRFRIPFPLCTRLHFFKEKLPLEGSIESPDQIEILNSTSYLGFCVVRPTEFNRIARTVLKYPDSSDERQLHFLTCQALFTTHIFGRKFKVFGTPFIQQDTQVGACAHAALWMVARYMHALGHCEEVLPNEINDLAKSHQSRGRRYPANDGLVPVQMLEALDGIGLSAIDYNYTTFKGLPISEKAKLIYHYVESDFPVIIGLETHSVLAIGHTLNTEPRNEMRHVPSFIIHDDLIGPYLQFPITPAEKGPKGVPVSIYNLKNVDSIIAVLPESATLQGEFAESSVISFLKVCHNESKDPVINECLKTGTKFPDPNTSTFRTFLTKATNFQQELLSELDQKTLPRELVNLFLRFEYPQYIWVTEVYSTGDTCIGKFILDSTAARWDRSIMAIMLANGIFLFSRQDLQALPYIGITEKVFTIAPRKHPCYCAPPE